jgi:UDP-N-acetylglucosamine 4,6-dehydratase
MNNNIDKVAHYLLIGGSGSLGHKLTKYLLDKSHRVTIISRDEEKQWRMKMKYPLANYIISDIRNYNTIKQAIINTNPNYIIIAAAMKHIDACEQFVWESVQTNIIGIKNVIDAVLELNPKNLKKVLLISTDKSCSPVNVYGMCKSIAEKLIINASKMNSDIVFCTCRYGNVLNSRGSIIPKLIDISSDPNCGELPLTHPEMTRFFMTLEESVDLIINAITHAQSGDIFIPYIKSFKLLDLFEYFSKKYNKPIKITGVRPGEKIHESLINQSEFMKTIKFETSNGFIYIIRDTLLNDESNIFFEYSSDKCLADDIQFVINFINKM